jgi:hypothetical protein
MPSSRLDSGRNANGTTSYICPATCVRMCYVCVFAVCELGALVYPLPFYCCAFDPFKKRLKKDYCNTQEQPERSPPDYVSPTLTTRESTESISWNTSQGWWYNNEIATWSFDITAIIIFSIFIATVAVLLVGFSLFAFLKLKMIWCAAALMYRNFGYLKCWIIRVDV